MGLTQAVAGHFLNFSREIAASNQSARWLSIGTVDFHLSPEYSLKSAIGPEEILRRHSKLELYGSDYSTSSRKLMELFVKKFDYGEYLELDINDRADLRLDLNFPVPNNLHQSFDLIWDVGSVEHVMNINQALFNLVDMCRLGGKIVHTQGLGDCTNEGYWTISPNFYLDFYRANGFEIRTIFLFDRLGRTFPYQEVRGKGSTIGQLQGVRYLAGHYFRLIRRDLQKFFPRTVKLINLLLRTIGLRSLLERADLGIFVVCERKELVERSFQIQNIYRGFLDRQAVGSKNH